SSESEFGLTRLAQRGEILAGVVGRAGERARGNQQETLGLGDCGVGFEFLGRHVFFDLVVLAGGLQVLADGEEIDVRHAQIVHQLEHFVARFAKAHHDAGLGEHLRVELFYALKQADRVEIAGAGTDREVFRRHGFEIVVEDVGLGGDDDLKRAFLAQEVRRQDLDGGARVAGADGEDHVGEMPGTAIGQIVAIDRSDDDMFEAELFDGLGDVFGFVGVEGGRQAGAHVAEGAGAGADFAHDHHGGVLFRPALADIGAAGFLADGDQPVLADDLLGFAIYGRTRRLDPNPVGLAQHFGVGPPGLFRMTGGLAYGRIEKRYHICPYRAFRGRGNGGRAPRRGRV